VPARGLDGAAGGTPLPEAMGAYPDGSDRPHRATSRSRRAGPRGARLAERPARLVLPLSTALPTPNKVPVAHAIPTRQVHAPPRLVAWVEIVV
jgi:hypothetical protein